MGLLEQLLFVNVEHLHVFEGLFEELDAVFVIGVKVVGLGKHAGTIEIIVCFILAHLHFILWCSLCLSSFLIGGAP
jgi:hypothetical protein